MTKLAEGKVLATQRIVSILETNGYLMEAYDGGQRV
jgi:hypothetical protein